MRMIVGRKRYKNLPENEKQRLIVSATRRSRDIKIPLCLSEPPFGKVYAWTHEKARFLRFSW